MQIDMRCTYAIDDGHGQQITTGVQWAVIEAMAQQMADERGESVYVYVSHGPGKDDPAVEVAPRA